MADFSWLTRLPESDWERHVNGECLRAMSWLEFQHLSGVDQENYLLVDAFMSWAEKQSDDLFALTWDVPTAANSDVYVCRKRVKIIN